MNNDPTKATNTEDTGTDGLKFDLPPGQTPGEGLGTGQTGMTDFNADDPSQQADKADWNEAVGDSEKSADVSVSDQDNTTV